MSPEHSDSIWTVVGAMTAIMAAMCTLSGFIIKLMIGNAVLRLESKIASIDVAVIQQEVSLLRNRQHDMAQALTVTAGFEFRIKLLEQEQENTQEDVILIGKDVAKLQGKAIS